MAKKGTLGFFDKKKLFEIGENVKSPKLKKAKEIVEKSNNMKCMKCKGELFLVKPNRKMRDKFLYECKDCQEREYK